MSRKVQRKGCKISVNDTTSEYQNKFYDKQQDDITLSATGATPQMTSFHQSHVYLIMLNLRLYTNRWATAQHTVHIVTCNYMQYAVCHGCNTANDIFPPESHVSYYAKFKAIYKQMGNCTTYSAYCHMQLHAGMWEQKINEI